MKLLLPKRTLLARATVALLVVSAFTLAPHAQAHPPAQTSNGKAMSQQHTNAQASGQSSQGSDRAIILQNQPSKNAQKAVKPGQKGNDRAIILQRH